MVANDLFFLHSFNIALSIFNTVENIYKLFIVNGVTFLVSFKTQNLYATGRKLPFLGWNLRTPPIARSKASVFI